MFTNRIHTRLWLRTLLLLGAAALCVHVQAHAAERRVALVIGNGDYAIESKLANPTNDAQLIARTLRSQGFAVDVKINLPKRAMELAIAAFVRQTSGADSAVLYYAGHGAQPANGGRNYLLPVDARVEGDDTLDTDGIAADRIVEQLERSANPAKIRVVVLDACRNNRMAGKTRSSVRGLSRMSPGDDFTLIAFSTNDQDVAQDGTGANSPYAHALSKHLANAGEVPLRRIFELTATDVRVATSQKQKPRTYGDLDSRMLLGGTQLASVRSESIGRPQQTDPEEDAWQATKAANTAQAFEAYLSEYPAGRYASAARISRITVHVPANPVAAATPSTLQPAQQSSIPRDVFKDCADCPDMVVVPSGSFMMGGNYGESEQPIHAVNVKGFAMGKYEIAQAQWRAVMGANSSEFKACGDNCPVETVSWDEAQAFIQNLNAKTGKNYRLPSEAEWEYACRAGGAHTYCGSESVGSVAVITENSGARTIPVGSKQPNAWGLYDMSGNVSEWTQDCWNEGYSGAPGDAGAWTAGNCSVRVLRGGAWGGRPSEARAAHRSRGSIARRYIDGGFRIAKTLP